jgi:ATP-dependent Clp protease adaptor protein ClpS
MGAALFNSHSIQWQKEEDVVTDTVIDLVHNLIVWNDDVNTFEWVAQSLIEICQHSPEQAEQCAFIIHNKGKYGVKKGPYDMLKPQCEALLDRGIQATIDS